MLDAKWFPLYHLNKIIAKGIMALRKVKYDENGIPDRIRTGIGEGTIPFKHADFYGSPEDFKWTSNTIHEQYLIVKLALERNGLTEVYLGAERVRRKHEVPMTKMAFVLVAGTPDSIKFVWQKHESPAKGSGQNHIFVGGQKIKMSSFMAMTDEQQDDLIEPCILRRTLRLQGLA
jgi:hypothetical protein